jgi:hypothetical protein
MRVNSHSTRLKEHGERAAAVAARFHGSEVSDWKPFAVEEAGQLTWPGSLKASPQELKNHSEKNLDLTANLLLVVSKLTIVFERYRHTISATFKAAATQAKINCSISAYVVIMKPK